jgi:hypothetical protein
VQRLCKRVAQLHAGVERHQHARRGGPVEAAAQHAREEREGDRAEGREEEHPDDGVGTTVDAVDQNGGQEQRQRDRAGGEHRPQRALPAG